MLRPNEVVQYVRRKNHNRTPYAVLLAVIEPPKEAGAKPTVHFGYSLCCRDDRWSRSMGLSIARRRAKSLHPERTMTQVPHSIQKNLTAFVERILHPKPRPVVVV